jgi:hypothetical protein
MKNYDNIQPWAPVGIANVTHGVYNIPQDLRWHGGPVPQNNYWDEWHYWTMVGIDELTGHRMSLFWAVLSRGWNKETGQPFFQPFISLHDLETGYFKNSAGVIAAPLVTEGTAEDDPNFSFKYACSQGEAAFSTAYHHPTRTWQWFGQGNGAPQLQGPAFRMEATSVVREPGYLPSAQAGLEMIGYTKRLDYNPETLHNLSYYITAPRMETDARGIFDGREFRVKGQAWFEQQYGNMNAPDSGTTRYFYGYCRLNNGDFFSWRTNYGEPGFKDIHPELNRYAYFRNGSNPEYAFGPAFQWKVDKTWTSPESDRTYPLWGYMETPQGTYYVGPEYPAQETKGGTKTAGYIEGVIYFREGGPDGPIVGMGFGEYHDANPYVEKFSGLPESSFSPIQVPSWPIDQPLTEPLKKIKS